MTKWLDIFGTIATQLQIGIGGTGLRRLRFKNSFSGDLEWTPTANRVIILPDNSGTVALESSRKVGVVQIYTGTAADATGWYDDYDGKWVILSLDSYRTIGNASSGADIAASWLQTLFEHFWNNYSNTQCPVYNGASPVTRGASATADWSANRKIYMPDYRGRVIGMTGLGSGLTNRDKAATTGTETQALTTAQLASHTHTVDQVSSFNAGGTQFGGSTGTTSPQTTTNSAGSGQAHNNMQPTAFEHFVISAGVR